MSTSFSADQGRMLRGAACGAAAAACWALQQPVDKAIFRCRYDDVELLGRAVARGGESWYPAGLFLHLQNGAVFGALYALVAPSIPLPAALRGPAAGLFEHVALWPLVGITDRLHPARRELPRLSGNRRAFAQALWRHLLFGFVLGELERRVNAPPERVAHAAAAHYSSNGHGSLEHAVPVQS